MKLRRRPLVGRTFLWILVILIGAWLIAPTLIVLPISFTDRASFVFPPEGWSWQWYANLIADPAWLTSLYASLRIAAIVTVLATIFGTAAAVGVVRLPRRWRGPLQLCLLSPLLAPQIVIAIAILGVYIRWGLDGTEIGFVLAHLMLATPYVVVTVSAALAGYDRRFDHAAESLGASPRRRFVDVTLPLLAPGIAIGAVFAFVTSFEETVIAIYIQSPVLRTLPVKMYNSVTVEIDPTIAAAASIVLAGITALSLIPLIRGNRSNALRRTR